jgi:hypothetical protein
LEYKELPYIQVCTLIFFSFHQISRSIKLILTAVEDSPRWPRDTPLSAYFGTKFRRQVAVAQSVYFACGLRATEFVFVHHLSLFHFGIEYPVAFFRTWQLSIMYTSSDVTAFCSHVLVMEAQWNMITMSLSREEQSKMPRVRVRVQLKHAALQHDGSVSWFSPRPAILRVTVRQRLPLFSDWNAARYSAVNAVWHTFHQ